MKKYQHYLNGKYVTEDKLLISPRDLGFMRSFAVFTVFKTYNEKSFKLKEHLKKMLKSAELINLKHNYTVHQLQKIVEETLDINKDGNEKTIKIILSGGVSDFVYQTSKPTLIILVDLLKLKPKEIYKKGIKMNAIKFKRYIPESKNTNYIEAVKQNQYGRQNGSYEPVFYSDKQVYEGSNSNIFVVKDTKIYTPKSNIYIGITRDVLLFDLKSKLNILEKNFNFKFLLKADEVFITGSVKEVVPVVKIDENIIKNGKIGPITIKVMKEFEKYVNLNK